MQRGTCKRPIFCSGDAPGRRDAISPDAYFSGFTRAARRAVQALRERENFPFQSAYMTLALACFGAPAMIEQPSYEGTQDKPEGERADNRGPKGNIQLVRQGIKMNANRRPVRDREGDNDKRHRDGNNPTDKSHALFLSAAIVPNAPRNRYGRNGRVSAVNSRG